MKLVYRLTYSNGFERNTIVKGETLINILNDILDTWKKLGITANLVDVER